MKIIKRGTIPSERRWEFTCRNCGTVFEIAQAEAKLVSDQRDGDYLAIDCPVCDKQCTQSVGA